MFARRHLGTVYDLEDFICGWMRGYVRVQGHDQGSYIPLTSYSTLKMGPITAHPEVKAHFHLGANQGSVSKVCSAATRI